MRFNTSDGCSVDQGPASFQHTPAPDEPVHIHQDPKVKWEVVINSRNHGSWTDIIYNNITIVTWPFDLKVVTCRRG